MGYRRPSGLQGAKWATGGQVGYRRPSGLQGAKWATGGIASGNKRNKT